MPSIYKDTYLLQKVHLRMHFFLHQNRRCSHMAVNRRQTEEGRAFHYFPLALRRGTNILSHNFLLWSISVIFADLYYE